MMEQANELKRFVALTISK